MQSEKALRLVEIVGERTRGNGDQLVRPGWIGGAHELITAGPGKHQRALPKRVRKIGIEHDRAVLRFERRFVLAGQIC